MQSYSMEYLDGIKAGRELKRVNNPGLVDMRAYLRSCEATMREFSAGLVRDMLKGERDFWRNQIKLAMCGRG